MFIWIRARWTHLFAVIHAARDRSTAMHREARDFELMNIDPKAASEMRADADYTTEAIDAVADATRRGLQHSKGCPMLKFLNFIPGFAQHGTKQLGALIVAIGGLLTQLTPQQLAAFHISPGIVVAVTGLLTLLRGFDNSSQAANTLPPPDPNARKQ